MWLFLFTILHHITSRGPGNQKNTLLEIVGNHGTNCRQSFCSAFFIIHFSLPLPIYLLILNRSFPRLPFVVVF
ncbi:hypothetical protein GGS24DRAFT_457971 [Hypoxylon argillaceum]|nr:hypothetical protein GGS24DRAFT_457971 [Hypoxylon argillaceum]